MTTDTIKAGPGDLLHVLVSGTTAFGWVWSRGDSILLNPEQVELTRDRDGRSWLDDLSEDAQIRRWGRPRFGIGPWPAELHRWTPGSPEAEVAREDARRLAWSHDDPRVREQALAEVDQIFGPAPTTSRTTNAAPDPSIRRAERQDEARRLAGVRQVTRYSPGEV